MIDLTATPRERIVEALKQAGEAGLAVADLVTATALTNYVVLYTLRNMKDAGRVTLSDEGGEKYQRDRRWMLNPHYNEKALGRPADEDCEGDRFEKWNRKLIAALTAAHPHGHEDARRPPKARLEARGVAA